MIAQNRKRTPIALILYALYLTHFDVDKHGVNSIFIDETEINVRAKLGYG